MKKILLFTKRNLTEMIRDPLIYIFCVGFPILMTLLFNIILKYTPAGSTPVFYEKSLIPGIIMFSFSMLMLITALLVSKDRQSAFLKRLFTSPLKPYQFIVGYLIPVFIIGIAQIAVGISLGYIFGAISGRGFTSFGKALLLFIEMIPMLLINVSLGMMFGTILNDKSAPGICSVFISASGVIGGAWMPIDIMGGFEKVCGYLPFYQSVYIGRCITGATHTPIDEQSILNPTVFSFSDKGGLYLGLYLGYMVLATVLSLVVFTNKMKKDIN